MTDGVGIIELSFWQLALALLLVGAVVAISIRQALGLERDLLVGAVRTVVQLYLVGLILAAVFAAARWYWVLLILIVMVAVATHAAVSRLTRPIPGIYWIAAARSRSRRRRRWPTSSRSSSAPSRGGSRSTSSRSRA